MELERSGALTFDGFDLGPAREFALAETHSETTKSGSKASTSLPLTVGNMVNESGLPLLKLSHSGYRQ